MSTLGHDCVLTRKWGVGGANFVVKTTISFMLALNPVLDFLLEHVCVVCFV